MIRATQLGKVIVFILALFLFFGAIYLDPFFLAMAVVVAAIFLLDLAGALRETRRPGMLVTIEPAHVELKLLRGDSESVEVQVNARRGVQLETQSSDVSLATLPSGSVIQPGLSDVRLEATGRSIGESTITHLKVRFGSRFGLLDCSGLLPVDISVRTYPRFLAAAARAMELLTAFSRRRGASDTPSPELGLGLEYYGTREYMVGDPFRFIDWKGTARLGLLLVREYQAFGSSSMILLCNLETPGPATHDVLATAFINTLTSLAYSSIPVTAVVHSGNEVLLRSESSDPLRVLSEALGFLLRKYRMTEEDMRLVLEPKTLGSSARLINALLRDKLDQVGMKQEGISEMSSLILSSFPTDGPSNVVIHTPLLKDTSSVLDLTARLSGRGSATVVYHDRPWVDAEDLEQAYVMKKKLESNLRLATQHAIAVAPLNNHRMGLRPA